MKKRVFRNGKHACSLFKKAFLITLDTLLDDLDCRFLVLNLFDCGFFVFQRLVNREEVAHFVKDMERKLGNIRVHIVVGIVERDRDDLFVASAVIHHRDHADGVAFHDRHGVDGFGAKDENVKRVSVIAVGSRNEAVVCGIVCRGIEDSVQTQKSTFLIQFVFFLRALRNFDDTDEIFGLNAFFTHIVPDVAHYFYRLSFIYHFIVAQKICFVKGFLTEKY